MLHKFLLIPRDCSSLDFGFKMFGIQNLPVMEIQTTNQMRQRLLHLLLQVTPYKWIVFEHVPNGSLDSFVTVCFK